MKIFQENVVLCSTIFDGVLSTTTIVTILIKFINKTMIEFIQILPFSWFPIHMIIMNIFMTKNKNVFAMTRLSRGGPPKYGEYSVCQTGGGYGDKFVIQEVQYNYILPWHGGMNCIN